jgi:hypothetical protein
MEILFHEHAHLLSGERNLYLYFCRAVTDTMVTDRLPPHKDYVENGGVLQEGER